MKIKRIHEKVYNAHLLLIYDCKAKQAERYLHGHNIKTDLTRCSGQMGTYTVKDGEEYEQQRYYIYIEKGKEHATLIHELAHLVFVSLWDCGIRVTQETDEIFAYYLEWWFNQLWKVITKK